MKVALIGSGKTGHHVALLHKETSVFNSKRPPNEKALRDCDVVISFLPGQAFKDTIPLLLKSRLPVVTGSTGISFPDGLKQEILDLELKWISGTNFSLGMNLVYNMIRSLSQAKRLFSTYSFHIHEEHHKNKIDAPSGTALSWKEWLNDEAKISSKREGDTIGFHEMIFESPFETIQLSHEARDRAIFAKGALWAAKRLLFDTTIPLGLTSFSEMAPEGP